MPYPQGVEAERRKRLEACGQITAAQDGAPMVRVYLQYLPSLETISAPSRRQALRARFAKAADGHSVELDPTSLSESGQVIEALVPVERFDQVSHDLGAHADLQVDLVQRYQMG